MADVDLTFLSRQSELILQELRDLRREVADVRTHTLLTSDYVRRLERRMGESDRKVGELKDDLELMIKSELMGHLANFESRMERHYGRLELRVEDLEAQGPTSVS